jgi:DNA-binding response OmpR family regulator
MSARILIVEDEPILALDIKEILQEAGYSVVGITHSGAEAIELCGILHPQLVLMDIQLEDSTSGTEAAFSIQGELDIPVVFLTSFIDSETIESAQASSPYGYLHKPCRPEILLATVQLALKQYQRQHQLVNDLASARQFQGQLEDTFEAPQVRLSASTQYQLFSGRLLRDGAPIKLTPKEQKFLDILAAKPGEVIPFERIYAEVWNSDQGSIKALRTMLHRLRQKSGGASAIESVFESGYRIIVDKESE